MKEKEEIAAEITKKLQNYNEGSLLWDEYKYRHDLIWKHLIRSTIAVIALVIIPYSTKLIKDETLILVASLLAIGYIIFTYVVIKKELVLFRNIELLHRKRQNMVLGLKRPKTEEDEDEKIKDDFKLRVLFYLGSLFLFAIAACGYTVYHMFLAKP